MSATVNRFAGRWKVSGWCRTAANAGSRQQNDLHPV